VPEGYRTIIPPEIMTPDRVETGFLGVLDFDDGRPSEETAAKLFDHLLYLRGVEVFLNWMPAGSIEALRVGHLQSGLTEAHHVGITEELLDSKPLFLTGDTDTVYASAFLDLERDGPTVVDVPPDCGSGSVIDAFFRPVVDVGAAGPDHGKGGKYLILPPDAFGLPVEFPDSGQEALLAVSGKRGEYHVVQSPSYTNWLIVRGDLVDGNPEAAVKRFKDGLRIYPLKDAKRKPQMKFRNLSKEVFNTIHANDQMFFEELNHVIQKEPVGFVEPELRGMAAAIGIEKGTPFKPSARTLELLKDAAKVGNGMARAICFDPRDDGAFLYKGSQWKTAGGGGDYRWLKDGGLGGRDLDARTRSCYFAAVQPPSMAGEGAQSAWIDRDQEGRYFDGSETYRMNIPADVPAADFWSVAVYDPQTRSLLQTRQPSPGLNSKKAELEKNDDGSVDLYFGPGAPEGKKANWIQTVRGKGWFAVLRLHGPLEPWFDKSWKPGEIELVE